MVKYYQKESLTVSNAKMAPGRALPKVLILDRDGVVNYLVERRDGYLSSPRSWEEFSVREDFKIFMQNLDSTIKVFVASNQPEIKRGLSSVELLEEITFYLLDNFRIGGIAYCLHDADDRCDCRKPSPGLLNFIVERENADQGKAIFVGDTSRDRGAAHSAGVAFKLLSQTYNADLMCCDRLTSLTSLLSELNPPKKGQG